MHRPDVPGLPLGSMTDVELIAWAAGYLAGSAAAARDPELEAPPARTWSLRDLERAGRRRIWDLMVLAGEVPTEEEIERRLWEHPKS